VSAQQEAAAAAVAVEEIEESDGEAKEDSEEESEEGEQAAVKRRKALSPAREAAAAESDEESKESEKESEEDETDEESEESEKESEEDETDEESTDGVCAAPFDKSFSCPPFLAVPDRQTLVVKATLIKTGRLTGLLPLANIMGISKDTCPAAVTIVIGEKRWHLKREIRFDTYARSFDSRGWKPVVQRLRLAVGDALHLQRRGDEVHVSATPAKQIPTGYGRGQRKLTLAAHEKMCGAKSKESQTESEESGEEGSEEDRTEADPAPDPSDPHELETSRLRMARAAAAAHWAARVRRCTGVSGGIRRCPEAHRIVWALAAEAGCEEGAAAAAAAPAANAAALQIAAADTAATQNAAPETAAAGKAAVSKKAEAVAEAEGAGVGAGAPAPPRPAPLPLGELQAFLAADAGPGHP
jgi:hypothetical protein